MFCVYYMSKPKPEQDAKEDLLLIFNRILESDTGHKITTDTIEGTIRSLVIAPNSKLSITNFYKLRRFFLDYYIAEGKIKTVSK